MRRKDLLKRGILALFIVTFSFCASPDVWVKKGEAGPITGEWGEYYALIIGINSYEKWPGLKTAVKDAEDLKDILIRDYGFQADRVLLRTEKQASRSRIHQDLTNMAKRLGPEDNLLIYFAGHGKIDEYTGIGYWIPVEGELKDPSSWLEHSTVKNILSSDKVKGKNIILVADSCYAGALLRGGPSLLSLEDARYQERLRELSNRKSRQVITSGGIEPVADQGREGHSLFAYYFLRALRENKRGVIDLENLIHSMVWENVARLGQRPSLGRLATPMDEDGQFVLVRAGVPGPDESRRKELEEDRRRLEAEQKRKAEEAERLAMEERKRLEAEQNQREAEKRAQEERERQKGAQTYKDPTTGMEFLLVKSGCFDMGDTFGDGDGDEKPVHQVCLGGFYLGKYEVTQGQWKQVMGSNASYFKDGDSHPVQEVSWNEVQNFIAKLRKRTGKDFRLPTEAEWEYAARSGGKKEKWAGNSSESKLYGYAWYLNNSKSKTHPVGQKRPNNLGLYDMSGNVSEWCSDWYGEKYYGESPKDNPQGPNNGQYRVVRGGSWGNVPGSVRASDRNWCGPSGRNNGIGFRLALSAPQ